MSKHFDKTFKTILTESSIDWSSMTNGQLDFAASLGLGLKYVPTPEVFYQCPKCKCQRCKCIEEHPDTDMNDMVYVCPDCNYQADTGFEKVSDNSNPYRSIPCPICGEFANGRCRCSGPHSIEDLKKGHGLHCPNGHNFTSKGWAYDPKTDLTINPNIVTLV